MKTATSLTLIAIGAIFAFAITSHPSFLNVQVAGLVVLATGVVGLILPRRGYGWLRRRVVAQDGDQGPVAGRVDEEHYPSYVMLNPAALDSVESRPEPADADPLADTDEVPEWEIRPDDSRSSAGPDPGRIRPGQSDIIADS